MKNCPKCGSRYTDDTLSFCLSDGSPLSDEEAASAITVVIGETETVARPAVRGQVPGVAPARSSSNRTFLAVLLTAFGMLFLFGVIAVVGVFVWRNLDRTPENKTAENRNAISPTLTPTTQPTPKPTATSAKSTTTPTPMPTVDKTPELRAKYPSRTRLAFDRGEYSVPFMGDINAGDSRTFVLACRSGQSLTATVNGGSCVSFSGGGSSLSRTTSAGDNAVTVKNSCSEISRFSLRISVF
jgi:hypothetical protein